MYTLYKINADELNENFIASIKAQFQHKDLRLLFAKRHKPNRMKPAIYCAIPLIKRVY